MNNVEPLTPYDIVTIVDHVRNETVWRGAFFNLPEEHRFTQLFSYEICIEYNYHHVYAII